MNHQCLAKKTHRKKIKRLSFLHFNSRMKKRKGHLPDLTQKINLIYLLWKRKPPKSTFIVYFVKLTVQKMKLSIKDLFSKCYQICRTLWIWSYLLKKSFPVDTRRLYDVADVETTCVYWVKGKLNNLYSGKT